MIRRAGMKLTYLSGFTKAIYRSSKRRTQRATLLNPPWKHRVEASCSHLWCDKRQWSNNESPSTEICNCKWNDGFGAKPTLTNHKQHGETISIYRQNGQKPAKNPKPSVHCVISTELYKSAFKLKSLKINVWLFYKQLVTFALPYLMKITYIMRQFMISWL